MFKQKLQKNLWKLFSCFYLLQSVSMASFKFSQELAKTSLMLHKCYEHLMQFEYHKHYNITGVQNGKILQIHWKAKAKSAQCA